MKLFSISFANAVRRYKKRVFDWLNKVGANFIFLFIGSHSCLLHDIDELVRRFSYPEAGGLLKRTLIEFVLDLQQGKVQNFKVQSFEKEVICPKLNVFAKVHQFV